MFGSEVTGRIVGCECTTLGSVFDRYFEIYGSLQNNYPEHRLN